MKATIPDIGGKLPGFIAADHVGCAGVLKCQDPRFHLIGRQDLSLDRRLFDYESFQLLLEHFGAVGGTSTVVLFDNDLNGSNVQYWFTCRQ